MGCRVRPARRDPGREALTGVNSKLGPAVVPSLRPDGIAIRACALYLSWYISGTASRSAAGLPLNAVCNALAPRGVRHIEMPLTPDRVWAAIQAAK